MADQALNWKAGSAVMEISYLNRASEFWATCFLACSRLSDGVCGGGAAVWAEAAPARAIPANALREIFIRVL
jgi:hypothetical protein